MAYARDQVPRSDMTPDQRRRIGALQAAKAVLIGTGYSPSTPVPPSSVLIRMARYIEKGE